MEHLNYDHYLLTNGIIRTIAKGKIKETSINLLFDAGEGVDANATKKG